MEYDFQFESFKNIYEFQKELETRPVNDGFHPECGSEQKDSWCGTRTYEEADKLLTNGWDVKLEEIKTELKKYSMRVERICVKHKPSMAGFAPIIPAAIKGVPKSMWTATPRKKLENKNYLHIYFSNDTNAGVSSNDIMKSGLTVLKLCILLEKLGIKTKIDIMPFFGSKGNSIYSCKIGIKDYRQPFNVLKMAYPIAHTSIFRRHGFKWLEKMHNFTNKDFFGGYGGTPLGEPLKAFKEKYHLEDNGSVFITYKDVSMSDFDPEKLASRKGLHL